MRGKLLTIEGIDGAGKTTLAAGLLDVLTERGIAAQLLREPGGAALSERLREVVKDPGLDVDPRLPAGARPLGNRVAGKVVVGSAVAGARQ